MFGIILFFLVCLINYVFIICVEIKFWYNWKYCKKRDNDLLCQLRECYFCDKFLSENDIEELRKMIDNLDDD